MLQNALKFTFNYDYDTQKKTLYIDLDTNSCILCEQILRGSKNLILKHIFINTEAYIKNTLLPAISKYINNIIADKNYSKANKSKVIIPTEYQTLIKYIKKYKTYNLRVDINVNTMGNAQGNAQRNAQRNAQGNAQGNANANADKYDKYISFGDLYIKDKNKLLYSLYKTDDFDDDKYLIVLNDLLVLIKYKIVNNTNNNNVTQGATEEATEGATDASLLKNNHAYLDFAVNEHGNGQGNGAANYLEISPKIEIIPDENIEIEPKSLEDTKIRAAALLLTYSKKITEITEFKEIYEQTLIYLEDMKNIIKDSIIHMEIHVSEINKLNKIKYNSIFKEIQIQGIKDFLNYDTLEKYRIKISKYYIYPCNYSIGYYRVLIDLAKILDYVYAQTIKLYEQNTISGNNIPNKKNYYLKSIYDLFYKPRFHNYKDIKALMPMLPKVEIKKNSYNNQDLQNDYDDFIKAERMNAEKRSNRDTELQKNYV
jgi:hypothetical protein